MTGSSDKMTPLLRLDCELALHHMSPQPDLFRGQAPAFRNRTGSFDNVTHGSNHLLDLKNPHRKRPPTLAPQTLRADSSDGPNSDSNPAVNDKEGFISGKYNGTGNLLQLGLGALLWGLPVLGMAQEQPPPWAVEPSSGPDAPQPQLSGIIIRIVVDSTRAPVSRAQVKLTCEDSSGNSRSSRCRRDHRSLLSSERPK